MNLVEKTLLVSGVILLGLSIADEMGYQTREAVLEKVAALTQPRNVGGAPPPRASQAATSCLLNGGEWECQ
jgi:hypothetical protein